MKNWKQWIFVGIIAIFGIIVVFVACDKDKNDPCKCDPKDHLQVGQSCDCGGENCDCTVEQPKFREVTITPTFEAFTYNGEDYEELICLATVQGTLLEQEWNGVAGIIETALTSRFKSVSETQKRAFRRVYSDRNVTIVLVKNPEYDNYSATLNGDTVYINFAILNDADALGLALSRTNQVMGGNTDTPTEG